MTHPMRAWSVTLSFVPPGPLHSAMLLAPEREGAVALAVLHLMQKTPTDAQLHAVLVDELPVEMLRHMLRAVEGRLPDSGTAEVMRLVPTAQMEPKSQWLDELNTAIDAEISLHHRRPPPDDGPAAA